MINDLKESLKNYKPYINGHDYMKKASVFIPIVKKDNEYCILFELRSSNLNSQPNEISFPGGKIESNESPVQAAVRETCEELGTYENNIDVISELDLFINPSNILIHPFVGVIKDIDSLNINKDEVDHVFLVPISYLLNNEPSCYKNEVKIVPNADFPYELIPNKENYKFKNGYYNSLFYIYKDYVIWGITATILENFLNLFTQ